MSVKKSYRRIESWYYFCDYCNKKMDVAPGPEEPRDSTHTNLFIDAKFIHTDTNHIHTDCLQKLLEKTNGQQA